MFNLFKIRLCCHEWETYKILMNDNMKIYCSASHNWSLFLVYSLKSFHLWITNISVLYLYTTVCVMKTMLKYLQYISHQMDTRSTKRNGGICQKMYSMFYGYSSRRTCSHRYYKAYVTCVSYVNGCFFVCVRVGCACVL